MSREDLSGDHPDNPILTRRRQQRERTRQRLLATGGMFGLIVLAAVSFEMGRLSKGDGVRANDSGRLHTDTPPTSAKPNKKQGSDGLNQQMKDVFRIGQDMPATPYGKKDPAAEARNTPNTPPLFDGSGNRD